MKALIKIEEFVFFLFSIYLFTLLDYQWWYYPLFFLVPDLGMLGYTLNTKLGALIYNLVHHRGVSLALYMAGAMLKNEMLCFAAIILFGHSSLDRVFDYGLKYPDDFKHTHLT
ncbi:MAG: DUF4260 domain-containing protein [bacterium]|nr:DUF4260 domain-containing protein [bacterium]